MKNVLYIQASPRAERSASITAADAFVEALRGAAPATRVTALNLFEANLRALARTIAAR